MSKAVRSFKYCLRCRDPREVVEGSGRCLHSNGYCNRCSSDYARERRARPEVRSKLLEQHRAHYYRHHARKLEEVKSHNRKLRLAAIEAYGGRCACCGENHLEFLCIDHINGGGNRHRKEIRATGSHIFRWLRNQGYPAGFRVLCHNCNMALALYGYCPHGNVPPVKRALLTPSSK